MKTLSMKNICFAALALAAALGAGPSRAASQILVTITGAKQGVFHGSAPHDQIRVIKYSDAVTSPRDAISGQATGHHLYQPVMFEKVWDAGTTQIAQALITNETLRSVVFDFYTATADGVETLQFRVTLTNALITAIHRHTAAGDMAPGVQTDPRLLEDISLTFQKITIQDVSTAATGTTDEQARAPRPVPVPVLDTRPKVASAAVPR